MKTNQFLSHSHDDSGQELRAFALEYVKQIVAKASEIAQERQEAKNAYKLAQLCGGDATAFNVKQATQTGIDTNTNANANTNKALAPHFNTINKVNNPQLRQVAAQIDNKFKLQLKQWPMFSVCDDHISKASKETNNKYIKKDRQSDTDSSDADGRSTIRHRQQDYTTTTTTTDNPGDCTETIASNKQRRDDKDARTRHAGSNRRTFGNKIGWSQFMRCLLTCFPDTVTKTMSSEHH